MNLDAVRVLACIAVVGLHTMRCDVSAANSVLYYLCGFAVPVFFMSSGYILMHREQITGTYILRKLGSVMLVVVLWNYLLYGAKAAALLVLGRADSIRITELVLSPLMSLVKKGVLYHFWYLGALMLVYLLLYVIYRLHLNTRGWVLCLIVLGGSVTLQVISYIHGAPLQKEVIQTFRLWTFMTYFLLGGVLAEKKEDVSRVPFWLHALLLLLFSVFIPVFQLLLPYGDRHAEYFYDDLFTLIWIGLLFTFVMRCSLTEGLKKVIGFVSPLTMGVYIVHIPLLSVVSHFVPEHSFVLSLAEWIGIFAVSLIVVYVLSKIPLVNKLIKL
ncbi:MAG: acyltransferase family protein [Oscillospiraceae bacterium]|nr:acyltransferase family protein [Oscillospiraceae bacterium]